jgi:hypothetical protein
LEARVRHSAPGGSIIGRVVPASRCYRTSLGSEKSQTYPKDFHNGSSVRHLTALIKPTELDHRI